ncbi:MAG: glycosyltransferase family 39 protein [Porphyrobacter sp.]|nr:glycosyltransferase family 39 protein [Porphyrobacter sp.]
MSAGSSNPPIHPRDPLGWTVAITLGFFALVMVRLTIPSKPFFDEIHYLPAARTILELSHLVNSEHPPMGKVLIALGMGTFGDNPLGWRIMSALFGTLGLWSAMRAVWFASGARFATIANGILLATAFPLFIHSRIAMLDIFMASFVLVALWMCAGAVRESETARWRLAIAGAAMGFAMACKWNAIPLAMMPGLTFLVVRAHSAGWSFLTCRRGPPVPGMTLLEAAFWLGLVPVVAYSLSYLPLAFLHQGAVDPMHLPELQKRMYDLQQTVVRPHTYMSVWYQWVVNWRAIWYLYEVVDGAQRGVLLIGNPLTMLIGLPAVVWCLWAGIKQRRWDTLSVFILYAVSLGFWIVAKKPVQFYYHYFLPSTFLIAALALTLNEFWQRGWRRTALLTIAASCAVFAFFYPILSAAPLKGRDSYVTWMWLHSWR